ncbi:MAG TPA: carbohydrate-binding family 9-like protein [Anaerolineae bacterium]|nr:carbohydrate-binding family 9-like protein [Anaerolineae bacterium]
MKKSNCLMIPILAALLICNSCERKEVALPRTGPAYTAVKISEPPVIDGILTENCWKDAEAGTLVLSSNGTKPEYSTTVRTVWDDNNLYVGFECQDPDAASTVTNRDGLISSQEYVSVCIDANADSLSYVMIEVAPTGVVFDAFVLSRDNGQSNKVLTCWDCEGLRVSVVVYGGGAQSGTEDRFWTVEIAIPFREFFTAPRIPPAIGDIWRVNFYRMDLTGRKDFSAFVPTGSESGQNPSKFSWLLYSSIDSH